nr:hypothetical protein [Ktedonobacteraceae bacterium]
MQQIRSCWHFLLAEPFRLIFSYLFQPTAFKSKFETDLIHRLLLILRICLPVFLCMYPIVLLVRLILPPLFPGLYVYTLANSGIRRFLFDTAWATALGTTGGILGAVTISTSLGITLCISVSLLSGITVDT